ALYINIARNAGESLVAEPPGGQHATPNASSTMPATRASGMARNGSSPPINSAMTISGATRSARPVAISTAEEKVISFFSIRELERDRVGLLAGRHDLTSDNRPPSSSASVREARG